MEYTPGTFTAPFWAQSNPFNKGRDPLGIQNSSVVVFSRLLPGLTNLTQRIRYYGFYLWMLEEYQSQPGFKNSYKDQYRFIRRAELLLACIMRVNDPSQTGVLGSNFTSREMHPGTALLDIAHGAALYSENSRAYWKYNSGAFGQFYVGSLATLGLVETLEGTHFFRRTEKGKVLAEAYNTNISPDQRARFLGIVHAGMLYVPDARLLSDFSLSRDIRNTPEWQFYLDTMMGNEPGPVNGTGAPADFPALRRQSLKLFLEHVQREPERPMDLPQYHYQHKGRRQAPQQCEAAYGWYYYQLNECLHYALETVFWYLLVRLKEQAEPQPVETFVRETVAVLEALFAEDYASFHSLTLEKMLQLPGGLVVATDTWLYGHPQEPGYRLQHAVLLLLACYRENSPELPALKEYIQGAGLTQPGNAVSLFEVLVIRKLDRPVSHFLEALVWWVINNHLQTAYRKMGGSEDNVLKLIVEDGHIAGHELVEPSFTSPRLHTLSRFTQDLRLIDDGNKLTETGHLVLQLLAL